MCAQFWWWGRGGEGLWPKGRRAVWGIWKKAEKNCLWRIDPQTILTVRPFRRLLLCVLRPLWVRIRARKPLLRNLLILLLRWFSKIFILPRSLKLLLAVSFTLFSQPSVLLGLWFRIAKYNITPPNFKLFSYTGLVVLPNLCSPGPKCRYDYFNLFFIVLSFVILVE